jgi:predicted amidophosphoribosyltransferase
MVPVSRLYPLRREIERLKIILMDDVFATSAATGACAKALCKPLAQAIFAP